MRREAGPQLGLGIWPDFADGNYVWCQRLVALRRRRRPITSVRKGPWSLPEAHRGDVPKSPRKSLEIFNRGPTARLRQPMPDVVNSDLYGNELRLMSQDVRLPASAKILDRVARNALVEDLRSASGNRGTQPVANVSDVTGPNCFRHCPRPASVMLSPMKIQRASLKAGAPWKTRRLSLGELKRLRAPG